MGFTTTITNVNIRRTEHRRRSRPVNTRVWCNGTLHTQLLLNRLFVQQPAPEHIADRSDPAWETWRVTANEVGAARRRFEHEQVRTLIAPALGLAPKTKLALACEGGGYVLNHRPKGENWEVWLTYDLHSDDPALEQQAQLAVADARVRAYRQKLAGAQYEIERAQAKVTEAGQLLSKAQAEWREAHRALDQARQEDPMLMDEAEILQRGGGLA